MIKCRRLKWADNVDRMEESKGVFNILTVNLQEGDLKEMGFSARNWVDSAQDVDFWRAFVNTGTYCLYS